MSREKAPGTVLGRIRSLLRKEERGGELSLAELDRLLRDETRRIEEEVDRRLLGERETVLRASGRMREVLARIGAKERDPAWHPKLEKIARTSVPAFIRVVEQHLQRPVPAESARLYEEAAGLLKGCIAAMKGSGKYLRSVFPEEMKEFREGVGELGAAVNRMTAALSEAGDRRERLERAGKAMESLAAREKEIASADGRLAELDRARRELEERVRQLEQEERELQQGPEHRELLALQESLRALEQEAGEILRELDRRLATMLGVFRRGANVLRHASDERGAERMAELIRAIEGAARERRVLEPPLLEACGAVQPVIESGILVLKGQDERAVFSGGGSGIIAVQGLLAGLEEADAKISSLRDRIEKAPVHQRRRALDRERGVQRQEGRRLEEERRTLAERRERLIAERAKLLEGLGEVSEALLGKRLRRVEREGGRGG